MNDTIRRASSRLLALSLAALSLAACSSNPGPDMVPDQPVRIASGDAPIRRGDCVEARRRVAQKANAYVDRLPSPTRMVPSPLPSKTMPAAVRRAKYNAVKITVVVDTLGRADMKTFTVVQSTHPWLAQSVKSAVARWKFTPAELAGCRVARTFEWSATSGRRG
jgi:hypothetical protein